MDTSYLGGALAPRTTLAGMPPPGDGVWQWTGLGGELFSAPAAIAARVFTWDGPTPSHPRLCPPRRFFQPARSRTRRARSSRRIPRTRQRWRSTHSTAASRWHSSTDRPGRVFLYRNLVGAASTYYHAIPGGLLFGSNLADLVEAAGIAPASEPRCAANLLPLSLGARPGHPVRWLPPVAAGRADQLGRPRLDPGAAAHLRGLRGRRSPRRKRSTPWKRPMAEVVRDSARCTGRTLSISCPAGWTVRTCRWSGIASGRRSTRRRASRSASITRGHGKTPTTP